MTRGRAGRMVALAVLATLAIGVGATQLDDDGGADRLSRARSLLEDPTRFESGIEAGETLAQVSELLLEEARTCDAPRQGAATCSARGAAAALAQGMAVRVLGCTAPGRFEAREALRSHLEDVESMDGDSTAPRLPTLPDC